MLYSISYGLELEQIKGTISADTFKEPTQREESKKVKSIYIYHYELALNGLISRSSRSCSRNAIKLARTSGSSPSLDSKCFHQIIKLINLLFLKYNPYIDNMNVFTMMPLLN
jgi:hypothetical protein